MIDNSVWSESTLEISFLIQQIHFNLLSYCDHLRRLHTATSLLLWSQLIEFVQGFSLTTQGTAVALEVLEAAPEGKPVKAFQIVRVYAPVTLIECIRHYYMILTRV